MQSHIIPIAMISDNNFIMQTEVAMTSIKLNKCVSTIYDVFVILVDADEKRTFHMQNMASPDFRINIVHVTTEQYRNIKQMAHVPLASLLKFDICELITNYDKILYIDGDVIVKEDLSELYATKLDNAYVAGVPHSIGIVTGVKKLNGGVLLFNAKKIRDEKLRIRFIKVRESLGDRKSMDQETFHIVFGENKIFLNPKYNVMVDKIDYEKKYYSLASYNHFFNTKYGSRKEIINKAVIVHFTGSVKPWEYRFPTYAKEWYYYYKEAFVSNPLRRKGRSKYLFLLIKRKGLRGVYWKVKDDMLSFLGEYFHIFLEKKHEEWN